MFFRMAIRTQKYALGEFDADIVFAPIGQVADVEAEALSRRDHMVPSECCGIAPVSATGAAPSCFHNQPHLALQAAGLLARIGLVPVVRIGVLALARTEATLPAMEYAVADGTSRNGFHHFRIIHFRPPIHRHTR